jgi:hypothetical protein
MPGRLPVIRLLRRLGLDRNPLRRATDRIETAATLGMLALFLAGGPAVAVIAGKLADAGGLRIEHAEASWHRVPAVLRGSAPSPGGQANPASAVAWVQAQWAAPDGSARTGRVLVGGGSKAGRRVTVWTDASGRLTPPPLRRFQVIDQVIFAAVLAPAVLAAVLLGAGWAVRRMLHSRRLTGWETAWSATGPQWTGQR